MKTPLIILMRTGVTPNVFTEINERKGWLRQEAAAVGLSNRTLEIRTAHRASRNTKGRYLFNVEVQMK